MSYFCYHGRKRLSQQSITTYARQINLFYASNININATTRKVLLSGLSSYNNDITKKTSEIKTEITKTASTSSLQSYRRSKIRFHDNILIRLLHHNNNTNDDDDDIKKKSNKKTIIQKIDPYMRLARIDKPIGTMLLLWPCLWSTALSTPISQTLPVDPYLVALFTVGSFVMRGAGCTINDMWDSSYDSQVKRTVARPIANKDITHKQAFMFLALQLSAGLGVLLSLPNTEYCFYLGAASLPLVTIYPLMKRYTNWPQLVLGMTFNWGCFMGWAATYGAIDYNVILPLYVGSICWTLVYDTLYAHQDKVDDAKLGLKSTALYFGTMHTKPILYAFSTISMIMWTVSGMNNGYMHPLYFTGMGLTYGHLLWQVYTADLDDGQNLAERFRSNQYLGFILFSTYVIGNLLR